MIGSTCGIAVNRNDEVFTWGQNRNGNLAHGNRIDSKIPKKVNNCPWTILNNGEDKNDKIAVISATRGQPNPKNDFKNPTGQEGPRIHLITESGKLYISGTCHKGHRARPHNLKKSRPKNS